MNNYNNEITIICLHQSWPRLLKEGGNQFRSQKQMGDLE